MSKEITIFQQLLIKEAKMNTATKEASLIPYLIGKQA